MYTKYFKIRTLGCKVNQYESQWIRERLIEAGYAESGSGQADIYVINTCTVTQKADKESREAIRDAIRKNSRARILATGCYSELDAEAIRSINSRIEIIGEKDKYKIPGIVKNPCSLFSSRKKIPAQKNISGFKDHVKAFIKIQDGCDNFCSYCRVPYARGLPESRPVAEILAEADTLIKNGYKELVLSGICLGSFGRDLENKESLVNLIRRISSIEGDFRIRLSSIELQDVNDELINEMACSDKLCHHLHIPLQSGDNEILKKMNRKYTAEEFIKRINYIRLKIPDIGITTDVIAGFPGEKDENFENTKRALAAMRPNRTHIFTYSPRKGTAAFKMKDDVPPEIKKARLKGLKHIADAIEHEFKKNLSGKSQRVLVERERDPLTGMLSGYTDSYIRVPIEGPDEIIGKLIAVNI